MLAKPVRPHFLAQIVILLLPQCSRMSTELKVKLPDADAGPQMGTAFPKGGVKAVGRAK